MSWGVSCQKVGLVFSRSRSQQGLIWSKYDSLYYIFWTADPFATKLGLIIHYHKPECFMKKLDGCVQGQGHSRMTECQWTLVQMISSESLNFLLLNLVWWIIIMRQIVFQTNWFVVFKVKVTVKDHIIKIWLSNTASELLILLQPNLVWWHIIISRIVSWKDWITLWWSRSRTQKRLKTPVNVHLDNASLTVEPS